MTAWQVYETPGRNGEPAHYSVARAQAFPDQPVGSVAGPFATRDEADREADKRNRQARNGGFSGPEKP